MSNTDSYRLTLGILFNFLIEAKKPIISSKDKLGGKEDKLSNFKILENILKIFSEERTIYFSKETLKKDTTAFRKCEIDGSQNIFFNASDFINYFKKQYTTQFSKLLEKLSDFITDYLQDSKLNSLINRLAAIIILDDSIFQKEEFLIAEDKIITKNDFQSETEIHIEIEPFLLSLFYYIIVNNRNNPLGKETFFKLYSQETKHSNWELKNDIGTELPFIVERWKKNISLVSTKIETEASKPKILKQEKEKENEFTQNQIIKTDRIYNQHAEKIYNIEHVENLN